MKLNPNQGLVRRCLALLAMLCVTSLLQAQEPESEPPLPPPMTVPAPAGVTTKDSKGKEEEVERFLIPDNSDEDGYAKEKAYSAADKDKACRKYGGKNVSYYGNVYKIEGCKLREIRSQEVVWKITERREEIVVVDADVIAALDKGEPITEVSRRKMEIRDCRALKNKYITYSYSDVYYVDEKCFKRPFPDWESFVEHRKERNRRKEEVLGLSWEEFNNLKAGKDMVSVMDDEFKRLLSGEAGVDVIPLDEACKGINGKDVSYVDRLYRIENCKKREYDPEAYLRQRRLTRFKLQELSASQWLSLPDGKPMVTH